MAGCYGNSREDRHFESMCDRHTDDDYGCTCTRDYHEDREDILIINGTEYLFDDLMDSDTPYVSCPECGEIFNIDQF